MADDSLRDRLQERLKHKVHYDPAQGRLYISRDTSDLDPEVLNYITMLRNTGEIVDDDIEYVEYARLAELQKAKIQSDQTSKTVTQADATELFNIATKMSATDIHIRKHTDWAEVLLRIDGRLQRYAQWPADYVQRLCATIYGAMADEAEPTFTPTIPQAARIAGSDMLPEMLYGIRISSLPTVGRDSFFFGLRLLYDDTGVEQGNTRTRLRSLGYSTDQTQWIEYMKQRSSGINILAGPTGSGKSTTQKHVLESLAIERPDLNIMTVEDPPEYPMLGVVQIPVVVGGRGAQDDRKQAFIDAIRSVLRSDPDIIMIGEIRDQETAHLAMQAAMTGHQVWTTLHANSSFAIISRMVDLLEGEMRNPLNVIADNSCLTGLVFQRLITRLCPQCNVSLNDLTKEELRERGLTRVVNRLSQLMDLRSQNIDIRFCSREGCPACDYKGERGRTVLSESVAPDSEMLRLIRERPTLSDAQQHWISTQEGKTILQHALEKIQAGEVDPFTVENVLGPLTSDRMWQDGKLEKDEIQDLFDTSRAESLFAPDSEETG